MNARLRAAWESRAPHERVVLAVVAVVLCSALYLWALYATDGARRRLAAGVSTLRTQSVLLDQQAAEHQRLRAMPAPADSPTDLRTLVLARTEAARLSGALARVDAQDADHVQVIFAGVSFADWLGWVAALQAQHVRLESSRVEALSAPGMVSATATLTRSRAR
jgi:type II secretory pathway component PulM